MGKRLVIVYHGTKAKEAHKILKEGFKAWTYFAKHLEDAIGYGGNYIFEVAYPCSMIPKNNWWQFRCQNNVSPESIVRLTRYNPSKIIVDNMVLCHKVCISNSTKAEVEYMKQDMKRNPVGYSKEELIAFGIGTPQAGS